MNALLPVDFARAKPLPAVDHLSLLRRQQRIGMAAIALFVGGFLIWSITTSLQGAIATNGIFVVASEVKRIQHPTGGVVSELRVQEGQRVNAGDIVMQLDDTSVRANFQIIATQFDEARAKVARLEAERENDTVLTPPTGLDPASGLAKAFVAEGRLFDVRRTARERKKEQMQKRMVQLGDEIRGLKSQQAAKEREAAIIAIELIGVEDLYRRKLVQITRLSALQRDQASIEGQRGQIVASIAQAEGKIAETEIQIVREEEELRADVMKELRETGARLAEFSERLTAARDQLNRVDLRAPNSGLVHELAMHTVGGVLRAGDTAMLIVPGEDELQLDLRVSPPEIDQVRFGQTVRVKVVGGHRSTIPDITGTVLRIGADTKRDERLGNYYYTVRINLPHDEIAKLAPLKVIAGMQAEAFIETTARSPIEFLLQPITDQVARTFRER